MTQEPIITFSIFKGFQEKRETKVKGKEMKKKGRGKKQEENEKKEKDTTCGPQNLKYC